MYGDAGGGWRASFTGSLKMQDAVCLRFRRQDGTETVQDVAATNGTCSVEMGSAETLDFVLESPQASSRARWSVEGVSFEYCPVRRHGE